MPRASQRAVSVPYPFAALVAQSEPKLALLLAAINPRIGGVLLSGPKGIGKTSLVRGVGELLPALLRAHCAYGCDPLGSSLCADCAQAATGEKRLPARKAVAEIVELSANAQIDDVVGAIDLKSALEKSEVTFRPGLLARANRSLLYVDEINLLSDAVVDVLLDAAAQGVVRVKRGQHAFDYPARFVLVGTMNPEEGELRPQITDRLGLRVFMASATEPKERAEIYRRNAAFARDPRGFAASFAAKTKALRTNVARAIAVLPDVALEAAAQDFAIAAVSRLGIDSHRTEFVALEAACALAAWEGRRSATVADVERVFPLAARLRRSRLRVQALSEYLEEDAAIGAALEALASENDRPKEEPAPNASGLVVSPELPERSPRHARTQSGAEREGQPVGTRALGNGRLDVPATLLDRTIVARAPGSGESRDGAAPQPEPKESLESSPPVRLTVFIVDASQSTAKSARAIVAAAHELLRPIYAGREQAALISCWGAVAEVVVDEKAGRNTELVAARLVALEPDETKALTPLPDALERARRIAERFRRANANSDVEIAVFSDGRPNVPLGGDAALHGLLEGNGAARELAEHAAEQCRTLAARLAGRATTTFVNVDALQTSGLMRELATLAGGRYFALNDVVAHVG